MPDPAPPNSNDQGDDPLARLERIAEEAERAVLEAATAAELEELRVRYLGRKAELTSILRSIPELAPEQRAPVGMRGNEARRALEELVSERAAALGSRELEHTLGEEAVDVTLPGDPIQVGHLHLITATRRELEDIFVGLGFRVVEGPEVELDYYNFTALNHPPGHPARMLQDTFYVSDEVVLRTHTSPMQVRAMELQGPPIYIVVPGKVYRRDSDATHTPMFHQLEGLAVDEGITLADLQGTLLEFARAYFGRDRKVRLRPHYFPFTEPSVEFDVSCFACGGSGTLRDGSRDPLCKGTGWIEVGRRGHGRPERVRVRARPGLRPRAGHPGVRVRPRHRPDRDAAPRRARPAPVLRERPAPVEAVLMRVPVAWLREYCDPGLGVDDLATALALSGTEVERIASVGVPRVDGNQALFLVGEVKSVEQHPDADRLRVCRVALSGADERTIVCGAPNVAAGQAVMVALPGAVLPDGTRLGRAKLRGVESDGMILSETEVQLGTDSAGIMVLPDSYAAGEEAQRYLPVGDDVLELEITPNRPDCLCVYGVAREVHAVTEAPLAPDPGDEDVEPDASGGGEAADLISVTVEDFELCPRFSVRVFEDVQVGPSPLWLKARLMAVGPAPDQQRRRHHELRDAAARAADARLRPRSRGRAGAARARRARGRAPHHAGRRGACLRRRRRAGLRRGRAHRDRRHHGRRRAARSARTPRGSRWRRRPGTAPTS